MCDARGRGVFTLEVQRLVLRRGLLVVDHTLHDAMHRVQQVGILAHGQQVVDLGVQKRVSGQQTAHTRTQTNKNKN